MPTSTAQQIDLEPGPTISDSDLAAPFADGAHAIAEGKRLYGWYNCAGCHFNGGGGIGPPLMDDTWVYGSDPHNIYRTIIEGRPNGMPSFGGKIPTSQAWQVVAYVRSLGGVSGSTPDPDLSKRPEAPAQRQQDDQTTETDRGPPAQ